MLAAETTTGYDSRVSRTGPADMIYSLLFKYDLVRLSLCEDAPFTAPPLTRGGRFLRPKPLVLHSHSASGGEAPLVPPPSRRADAQLLAERDFRSICAPRRTRSP